MHAAAQYLEGIAVITLVSLGLGLVAAWGIIRAVFALMGADVPRDQAPASKPLALLDRR